MKRKKEGKTGGRHTKSERGGGGGGREGGEKNWWTERERTLSV